MTAQHQTRHGISGRSPLAFVFLAFPLAGSCERENRDNASYCARQSAPAAARVPRDSGLPNALTGQTRAPPPICPPHEDIVEFETMIKVDRDVEQLGFPLSGQPIIVRDKAHWGEVWRTVAPATGYTQRYEHVNFRTHQLVVLRYGVASDSDRAELKALCAGDRYVRARVVVTVFQIGTTMTAEFVHIIKVPRTDKEYRLEVREFSSRRPRGR